MKNSKRKDAALVASGIILGAAIAAPAAGAALTAEQSSQKIVVDGKLALSPRLSRGTPKYQTRNTSKRNTVPFLSIGDNWADCKENSWREITAPCSLQQLFCKPLVVSFEHDAELPAGKRLVKHKAAAHAFKHCAFRGVPHHVRGLFPDKRSRSACTHRLLIY